MTETLTNRGANIGGRDHPAGMWRTRHFADYCGVTTRTIENWRADGFTPPFTRLRGGKHGSLAYSPDECRRWEREQIEAGNLVRIGGKLRRTLDEAALAS